MMAVSVIRIRHESYASARICGATLSDKRGEATQCHHLGTLRAGCLTGRVNRPGKRVSWEICQPINVQVSSNLGGSIGI